MAGIEIESTLCPACLSLEGYFDFKKEEYNLFKCQSGDFIFVHPYPSAEIIKAHYETNYRGASADFYPKSSSRRWRSFIRSLKFMSYAGPGKTVLDIGCGGGFMTEAFARLGASCYGIDISKNSINYAKNHFKKCQFYCETLTDFQKRFGGGTFDFVFSSEVLEHLPGTDEFMETLRHVTKKNGFVYLSAPDAGHPKVPLAIETWGDICPPEHLQFFNSKNLSILFERHGFSLHKRWASKTPAHSVIFKRVQ